MRDLDDIARLIGSQADMVSLLATVAWLGLPDAYVGAGFVRDAVWDVLHGREPSCSRLRDVDVAYFDARSCGAERDLTLEGSLREQVPSVAWDVKNQARMSERNGDEPYRDCAHAIAQWPETATAIGARLTHGALELCAPHGVADLLALVVRPTPRFYGKMPIYRARLHTKGWATRWPKLSFVE
jgi:uncharacterized protein